VAAKTVRMMALTAEELVPEFNAMRAEVATKVKTTASLRLAAKLRRNLEVFPVRSIAA